MPEVQGNTPTPEHKPAKAAPTTVKKTADKAVKKESAYPLDAKIRVLHKADNPKRKGSAAHAKFALYRDGMTVREFRREAKKNPKLRARLNLKWDIEKGYIKLEK